jgi:hypothetical protein
MTATDRTPTTAMAAGRRADSTRRRQRVLKALNDATTAGEEITVSGIAQRAGVDRTFLYRHRDLLEQVHATEAQPPSTSGSSGSTVSRASLQTDLLNAQQRCTRLAGRVQQRKSACPNNSASRPGTSPASAHPKTSTNSSSGSSSSSSKAPTYGCNSTNATRTSPPPGSPTGNS